MFQSGMFAKMPRVFNRLDHETRKMEENVKSRMNRGKIKSVFKWIKMEERRKRGGSRTKCKVTLLVFTTIKLNVTEKSYFIPIAYGATITYDCSYCIVYTWFFLFFFLSFFLSFLSLSVFRKCFPLFFLLLYSFFIIFSLFRLLSCFFLRCSLEALFP